jgi:hypothetical protein
LILFNDLLKFKLTAPVSVALFVLELNASAFSFARYATDWLSACESQKSVN